MHWLPRPVVAAAALLALSIAVPVAFGENNTDKTVPSAAGSATPPAILESTILNKHEVEGILGRDVRSATDEDMGRIVDVLVDRTGRVRAAIIDFGGFLGVGSRKIAVDWKALHFSQPGKPGERTALELTRDQVRTAPEYKEGKPVVVLGALGSSNGYPNSAGDVRCLWNHYATSATVETSVAGPPAVCGAGAPTAGRQ